MLLKNMLLKKLLPTLVVLTLLVLFLTYYRGPEVGVITKINNLNSQDFFTNSDVEILADTFLFEKKQSNLTSKFRIRNFELEMNVKTTADAIGEINFATSKNPNDDWRGYKVMLNNSEYSVGLSQKTGSLSRIRNNFVRTADEGTWFKISLVVRGSLIEVKVNDRLISQYTEDEALKRINSMSGMFLSRSFISVRKTSGEGKLYVSDFKFKPLKKYGKDLVPPAAGSDSLAWVIDSLNQQEFPLIDYHVHLKGGLTMDQACQYARNNGFNYGIAANCGLKFPVTNDSTLTSYLDGISKEPVFKVMQCEGREWITLFSPEAVSRFDYIFTDAMTWTDDKGRRMRLWMPEETFVDNDQQFMEMLVSKIEMILDGEPVDIHVNPTFLPASLASKYNELWTEDRMDRVINALIRNQVALEINARYKIPGIAFIKRAKSAGVKFSFGTNNLKNDDLHRLEYCLKVIKEVGLTSNDIFIPKAAKDRKVLKKGLPANITG